MLILPRNLGPLARIAAKENPRYAIEGVRVEQSQGKYTVAATDGHRAAVVTGQSEDPKDYPSVPALASAPNSAPAGVIPAKEWAAAFSAAPKGRAKPILQSVAVVMGERTATLASTDLERCTVKEACLVEGRFPEIDPIVPREAPVASVRVDAKEFAELLTVAAAVLEADDHAVTIELHGDKPLVVRARNAYQGQEFVGLMMPLGNAGAPEAAQGRRRAPAKPKPPVPRPEPLPPAAQEADQSNPVPVEAAVGPEADSEPDPHAWIPRCAY